MKSTTATPKRTSFVPASMLPKSLVALLSGKQRHADTHAEVVSDKPAANPDAPPAFDAVVEAGGMPATKAAQDVDAMTRAVAVYCASSPGKQPAFREAAASIGRALASENRPLVYGGGSKGLMGIVSTSVAEKGGKVTGVVPQAMLAAGGEGDKTKDPEAHGAPVVLQDNDRANVTTVVVRSMHERKVEMAKRVCAFIGLPGGFGTFEELLEAITWTQLGIHEKPVILINTLGYYEPLRALIKNGVEAGFIRKDCAELALFVNGPEDHAEHANFDWGKAALEVVDNWTGAPDGFYKWS